MKISNSSINKLEDKLKSLINRDEIRRLEKAAKDKDKMKLAEWAMQFEEQLHTLYEKDYKEHLEEAIDNFILAIVFTLHFNEKTKFGGKRLDDFMEDLLATIDNFGDGSYNPDEYREMLLKDGIKVISRNGGERNERN